MKRITGFYFILFISFVLDLASYNRLYGQIENIPVSDNQAFIIDSKILKEQRNIWIHLPANYNTSIQRYPVLYLLDGEGHFKYVSELTDYLSGYDRNRTPEMIVVAIVNVNRSRDFTPEKKLSNTSDETHGNYKFFQFVQNELVPHIDKHYKTQPYRVLCGHSLAGLFSLYAQSLNPDLFQASILMSPVVLYGENRDLLNQYHSTLNKHTYLSEKMFITLGDEDPKNTDALKNLLNAYAPPHLTWKFQKYNDENHFSVTYKSFYDGLKFIYQNWFIDNYNPVIQSYAELQMHFDKLSDEFGYKTIPPEDLVNNLGYKQLRSGNIEEAIQFFRENIHNYPGSWNAYDSMGEAYLKKGDKKSAIENYKKSVSINPDNTEGKKILQQLEK
ncbi:tetratricopeptide repeat protein [Chryseobacterium sp. X308]|uniref:alpha/beta hydrolase-fold protein n=1 Tax=Chryseobacterium sp. X308 TaxID=2884873 RepID=UPI001D137159|nr:alpha/beta hydrolase-fold protein [Chryseobacterium sp. X308]MCC3216038.1 tetratricopeptide repeat protein [Chryseobacterium sp. X308]